MHKANAMADAVYDGSMESVLIEHFPRHRAVGVVPSLHHLCCEMIMDTIINLENAPTIVSFARAHNVQSLLQRAEKFTRDSWRGLVASHDPNELEACIGPNLFAALTRDYEEVDSRVQVIRRLGSVMDTPPAMERASPSLSARTLTAGAAPSAHTFPESTAVGAASTSTVAGAASSSAAAGAASSSAVPGASSAAPRARSVSAGIAESALAPPAEAHGRQINRPRHNYEAAPSRATAPTQATASAQVTAPSTPAAPSAPAAPTQAAAPAPRSKAVAAAAKRFSFGGGGEVCAMCSKRVYAAEKMAGVPERVYHVNCFRCAACNTKLASHNYERTDGGELLCKVHYKAHLNANRPKASIVDGGSMNAGIVPLSVVYAPMPSSSYRPLVIPRDALLTTPLP